MKLFYKYSLTFSVLFLLSCILSCTTEDVSPFPPTLGTFTVPAKRMGSLPFLLTPPTSNSAGAFTYISADPSIATISGSTVTVVGIGTTTITATQAADAGYGSEENYTLLEKENIHAFIKYNYFDKEQSMHFLRDNYKSDYFAHDKETDTLFCPSGKPMHNIGTSKRKKIQLPI